MKLFHYAVVFLLLSPLVVNGQADPVQQAINEQVWKPFQRTYASSDAAGFLALHRDDIVRVIHDSKQILAGEIFRDNVKQNMANARKSNLSRSINFRFTKRFASGFYAYEQGYYKIISSYGENEQYVFYGKFDVVLRQEEGRWKIMLDADTSENGKITETDFLTGTPLE